MGKDNYLNESGIQALVKSIVKNLFESPNYVNIRISLSSLRDDLNRLSASSNEIVEVKCEMLSTPTQFRCQYPIGFDYTNTIIITNRAIEMGYHRTRVIEFNSPIADRNHIVGSYKFTPIDSISDIYLYLMKVNPIQL